jgi:hypothetical protein
LGTDLSISTAMVGFKFPFGIQTLGVSARFTLIGDCTDARGELVPYEQVLETNARFYVESQGVTATSASAMARAMLADMPAWRGRH